MIIKKEKKESSSSDMPEPSFLIQAETLIEDSYSVEVEDPKFGHGLNIRDHKLMVKLMSLHEEHVYGLLVDKFSGVVFEHYNPMMKAIEDISNDLTSMDNNNKLEHGKILTWLDNLSDKQRKLELRISRDTMELEITNKRLDNKIKILETHGKAIEKIEKDIALKEKKLFNRILELEKDIRYYHGQKPIILGIYKIERWVLVAVSAILVSAAITFISLSTHARKIIKNNIVKPMIENTTK